LKTIHYGRAICYSGYRKGQSPVNQNHPSYDQIKEDLLILEKDYDYIRMYDISEYTRLTLEVIKNEDITIKVLLTMSLLGEISNEACAWGGEYTVKELAKHIAYNQNQLSQCIQVAHEYKDYIVAVSAGNEASPTWNENLVSTGRILYFVNELKKHTDVPVTYCDNIHMWKDELKEVAEAVDFISIHVYPVWEGKRIAEAIDVSINQYNEINQLYKNKQVIITETGWPTTSNHNSILPEIANEKNQLIFNDTIKKWSEKHQITCFFFEAFDESWKGSGQKNDPEKHWGYYFEDRTPKMIVRSKTKS
jgi:exo-beta-1,3-glucanase (GH17 family)